MLNSYRQKDYVESYRELYIRDPFWRAKYQCNAAIIEGLISDAKCGRWVDLCCGQGQYFALAADHTQLQCIGIDASNEQISLAKSSGRLPTDTTFHTADIIDDALAQLIGPADLVTIMWGAYCYLKGSKEIVSMLENVARILRPGGSFYIEVIEPATLENFNSTSFSHSTGARVTDVQEDAEGNATWLYEDSGGTHRLYAPNLEWMLAAMNSVGLSGTHLSTVQTLHQVVARTAAG